MIAAYADPKRPYLSKPRPQFVHKRDQDNGGDYDLLARRAEWADSEEGGE
jgi:hypothetical protein